jgi:hypothetical protein
MRLVRWTAAASASVILASPFPSATAPPADAASRSGTLTTMRWIDLREDNAAAAPFRELWSDKLEASTRIWLRTPSRGHRLPAYTLAHVFSDAERPVLVSSLFDMYDCELPGTGTGADLYARCPMRIVAGASGKTKVTHIAQACHLYVPMATSGTGGPDPQQNKTLVGLDRNRTLRLRVIQFGREVPSCDMDLKLE